MLVTNGLEISGTDYCGRREDLSFIVRFKWKSAEHLREAIALLLAARLGAGARLPRRRRSEQLSDEELKAICLQVAGNPNTPPLVLDYLSHAEDSTVQERVASNPRSAVETLERLVRSPWPCVRAAVAENINATPDLLTVLGSDPDADVRYSIAENANMPEELLLGLAEDPNPYVKARAESTLSRLDGGCIVSGDFSSLAQVKSWSAR